jgi:intracellular multiplication protein IcmE
MAMMSNLKSGVSDPKSRVFLIVMAIVLVVVLLIGYTSRSKTAAIKGQNAGGTAQSKIKNVGGNMNTLAPPGGGVENSLAYKEIQKKHDEQLAQKALIQADKGGAAALPTIGGAASQNTLAASLGIPVASAPTENRTPQMLAQERQQDLMRQRDSEAKKQKKLSLLSKQIRILSENWRVNPQTITYAEKNQALNRAGTTAISGKGAQTPGQTTGKVFYKAGDILFAVLLTSVNSDQPGPVMAQVISGPLASSKVIGAINQASIPKNGTDPKVSQALVLEFNVLNIPSQKKSQSVNAIAIDPETARTSLASNVDNHYLLRYGTFLAANFAAGWGSAIAQNNAAQVITQNGVTTLNSGQNFSTSDQVKQALGATAAQFSKAMNLLDKPPTITIDAGSPVGLLLQQDLVLGGDDATPTMRQNTGGGGGYTQSTSAPGSGGAAAPAVQTNASGQPRAAGLAG